MAFAPLRTFQSVVISAPWFSQGERYALYLGGAVNGTDADGLYEDGTYSGGTLQDAFTLSSVTTGVVL